MFDCQLALETSQTAQSTSLGLNPVTVAAPNTVSSPPVNPVTVTPPVTAQPTITPPNGSSQTPAPQAAQATPTTPQASSTPVSSNPSPTITAPPIGTTTPAPVSSNPSPAPVSSQPIPLPAPINTLPSTVSSAVNPTSTQSPNTTTPPPITNPTSVTAPNQVTPPPTGSSSASSVAAPVGSVPVSSPNTVKPPVSAVVNASGKPPVGVVRVLWFGLVNGNCRWFGSDNYDNSIGRADECEPTTLALEEKAEWLARIAQQANGDRIRNSAQRELGDVFITLAKRDATRRVGKDFGDEIETMRAFIMENPEVFSPDDVLSMATLLKMCMAVCDPYEIRYRWRDYIKEFGDFTRGMRGLRADLRAGRILNPGAVTTYAGERFGSVMKKFMFMVGVTDYIDPGPNTKLWDLFDVFDYIGVGQLVSQIARFGFAAIARANIGSIFKARGFRGLVGRDLGEGMLSRGMKAAENRLTTANPNELNFSQRSAGGNGRTEPYRERMSESGWFGPPADVIKLPDGTLVTIDNTRVAVARELGITEIPVMIRSPDELLPPDMVGRFGTATTWGEALAYRTGSQKPPLPVTGSPNSPRLTPTRRP